MLKLDVSLASALEKTQVRENTIIVVWGDHGWHLGEFGIWGKATNYEIATRVPLIIWTPTMPQRGEPSHSLVELLDLYPTLCELARLPRPNHLAGEEPCSGASRSRCNNKGFRHESVSDAGTS